ncbi:MAG: EMC3/TMCO1 family protein [Phycisphaeraceae bacterium]
MLETINEVVLTITDPVLGWMLLLPRDVAMLILAVATALVLTLIRLVTTNQEYLGWCKRDRKQLKRLLREAKRRGDVDAKRRHRQTLGQIGGVQLMAEGKPLMASIVPIAFLAIWAFARLAFMTPEPGEALTFNAYFAAPRIGERVHVLPQDGLAAEGGWIQRVRPVTEEDFAFGIYAGMASWELVAESRDEPYEVAVRFEGETFTMPVLGPGRTYAPPIVFVADPRVEALTVDLTEYRPFGVVPGAPAVMLQPWIVGYLLIVVPMAVVLKPVLRIH